MRHLQALVQRAPPRKHSQYFLRQRDLRQWHPFTCWVPCAICAHHTWSRMSAGQSADPLRCQHCMIEFCASAYMQRPGVQDLHPCGQRLTMKEGARNNQCLPWAGRRWGP